MPGSAAELPAYRVGVGRRFVAKGRTVGWSALRSRPDGVLVGACESVRVRRLLDSSATALHSLALRVEFGFNGGDEITPCGKVSVLGMIGEPCDQPAFCRLGEVETPALRAFDFALSANDPFLSEIADKTIEKPGSKKILCLGWQRPHIDDF
jgi:hypothetical protein